MKLSELCEDRYDQMDPQVARANKKAKELCDFLTKNGIKCKLTAEGDYDTDPEITIEDKTKDGRNVSATVQLNGKYAFTQDDGNEFEFSDEFRKKEDLLSAIKAVM